jgi:FkbM family methyltransferase
MLKNILYTIAAPLNFNRYRLYSARGRNYRVYLNISESRMMFDRAVGDYESHLFDAIAGTLRRGMTFVDAGSNKGDFALFASHLVGPSGHVIAIEPERENCRWIRKSISANKAENVELCEMAIGDADGFADLHVGQKSGWHSLVTHGGQTVRVPLAKLDTLTQQRQLRIDAIKIDVEGADLAALNGTRHVIERDRPVIWIELHPQYGVDTPVVRDFLRGYGYTLSERGNECEARPARAAAATVGR